ncbi:MAG: hypothetical protein L3J74_06440 [Bacteroidales bacterium]|nr:hypothetical protein [Bacteroidales bacterium]
MKNTNIVIIIILFLTPVQLYSQKSFIQIGFGMHQDIHMGATLILDTILIEPYSIKDEYRPTGMISYQKRFKDKFEIEIGFGYSITYYGYIVGLYNSVFNSFTKKIGTRAAHTFTFPINVNISLTKRLYVKTGISATLGILKPSKPIYFNDTPEINGIYNSMQNIFKPNSINYGFGLGYKIWRFDIVYFRKNTIGKVTKPININNKDYEVFGRFYSNTFSIFYNFMLK